MIITRCPLFKLRRDLHRTRIASDGKRKANGARELWSQPPARYSTVDRRRSFLELRRLTLVNRGQSTACRGCIRSLLSRSISQECRRHAQELASLHSWQLLACRLWRHWRWQRRLLQLQIVPVTGCGEVNADGLVGCRLGWPARVCACVCGLRLNYNSAIIGLSPRPITRAKSSVDFLVVCSCSILADGDWPILNEWACSGLLVDHVGRRMEF